MPVLSVASSLSEYISQRTLEFDQIDATRTEELELLAAYIHGKPRASAHVRLTFICTHNSRRSHLAMIWAAVAADHFGIEGVETYSGGTEATAFNPRAVAAIRRTGMVVEQTTQTSNPIYHVRFSERVPALTCFSKVFDQAPNPTAGFAAIMVCGNADESCPAVAGVESRFAIRYVDPKASDDTTAETRTYDQRCAQIAREMLYLFSRVES